MAVARYLLAAVLLLVLGRYVWMGTHAHPHTDDWSYGAIGRGSPLVERLGLEYQAWNGRWASNILVLRGPLVLEAPAAITLYQVLPGLWVVLTVIASWCLLRSTLFAEPLRSRAGMFALGWTALFLNIVPDLGGALYWYTGAVSYHLPLVLFMVHLAALVSPRGSVRLLGALPLVWAMGSNEVVMVLALAFHTGRPLLLRMATGQWPREGAAWLVLAVGVALVMLLAPGNAARAALFSNRHQVMHSVGFTLAQTVRFVVSWIASPALLLASALFVHLPAPRQQLFTWSRLLHPFSWLLVALVMVGACFFLPYWSTGLLGQHRTANVACFAFLPCWFAMLDGWRGRVQQWAHHPDLHRILGKAFPRLLALSVFLLFTRNDLDLTLDLLTRKAHTFDQAMMEVYGGIGSAVEGGALEYRCGPLPVPPRTLGYIPLTDDPGAWPNLAMATWFGGRDFRIVAAPEHGAP